MTFREYVRLKMARRQRKGQVPLDAQPPHAEQADTNSYSQDAEIPPPRNEPSRDSSHGGNRRGTADNQENPREPGERRIREWLLVIFTGTIVGGTLFYACIARRQAQTMIEQREVMIQQVNASQR